MSRTIAFFLLFLALFSSVAPAEDHTLETCLRKDSISCIQIHVYKKLTALLSQKTIDLLAGFRIVKDKIKEPNGLSKEDNATDGQMSRALGVTERQLILEDFVFNKESVVRKEVIREGRNIQTNDVSKPISQVEESLLRKLNAKCAQRDASSCAMLKLITYMNRLLKKANIDVADNIEITQTTTVAEIKAEDLPRSISQESEEAQMAELLTAKLLSFVRSRALRLRLVPTMEAVITSNPDADGNLNLGMSLKQVQPTAEGRGKNKNMGGIMAMMMMKAGMMGALAFKGLVLLVGKALMVAKIALLLAVIIGLKKLFHHEKHVTYEVVAQPHHSHSHIEHIEHGHGGGGGGGGHDSYSSGWGRSADVSKKGDAHSMAYRAYVPKQ